jgi:hypothetical protein
LKKSKNQGDVRFFLKNNQGDETIKATTENKSLPCTYG